MIVVKLVLFMLLFTVHHCRLPDKVLCVNEQCNAPISKARTIMNFNSGDSDMMSFRGNAEAMIYMKSAGTNHDLWYATIDGKSGFVSSRFLKENKIYVKEPQFSLPVQVKKKEEVQPNKVQQTHEVVEGTTIYSTEPTVNSNVPEATVTPLHGEPTPSLANPGPSQADNRENKNVWNQNTQPMSEGATSTNTGEAPGTTVLPDLQQIQEPTPDTTGTPIEAPWQTKDTISSNEENIVSSTESKVQEPVKSYIDFSNNVETEENVPPAPESMHLSESLISGEVINAKQFGVAKQEFDITQKTYTKPQLTDNIEPNISNSVGNVKTQPPSETTSNIPSQPDQPPQYDNSLFGSVFKQEGGEVANANGVMQKLQETGSAKAIHHSQEQSTFAENFVVLTEATETTNVNAGVPSPSDSATLLTETTALPTESAPLPTESSTLPPESAPLPTESAPLPTESSTLPPKSSPLPTESAPLPTESSTLPPESAPLPTESVPLSTESAPLPTESIPLSTESAPLPTESIPLSTESAPLPAEIVSLSTESVPLPTESATLPTESAPLPIETSLPNENDNVQQIPKVEPPLQQATDINSAATKSQYEQSQEVFSSTESTPINDNLNYMPDSSIEQGFTTPESDIPNAENNEGFISSIFSTVSNMWDSTTPAPPTDNAESEAIVAPPAEQTIEGLSLASYLFSTYNSIMGTQDQSKALFVSNGDTCFTDEHCDGSGATQQNSRLLTFLITSASTVLLFTLGYYYLDNRKQDSKLIGNINSLQRDLLFATKETEILKEELATTKSKLAGIEDSSFGMDDMVLSLKEEINELKAQNERLRHSLDDNEKLLRVSENTAGELQNTLGEVENTLSELLTERANSDEQIAELNGKIQVFEEELITVTRDRDNFQLKYISCESALEESKKHKKLVEELNEKLKEASNTINLQKHEIVALKDALKELKNGLSPNIDVGSLIDHTEIKAKLAKALEEKKSFESKYEVEHKERSRLAEELDCAQESLRTTSQQANEASTRLEVLEKYFQERESELMKELRSKESLYLSKKGESASTVEKMELLQQEIQRFKEKCDALTLELAEQESSRRAALSEVEARAHQAWLEARAARRDADAARDDAAALRRKLAAVTAADGAASPHRQVSSPLDGLDGGAVPPLPPLAFLPPPLLPPLPRPPPLGRLPSPHPPRYNDRRYSPDSRYSPESRYSPGSRYSPETVRYSPDSRYSPRRRSPYSPRRRYNDGRGSRSRPLPPDTETEYNSDSPTRDRRRPPRYSRHSGASSGSGCSSESDK